MPAKVISDSTVLDTFITFYALLKYTFYNSLTYLNLTVQNANSMWVGGLNTSVGIRPSPGSPTMLLLLLLLLYCNLSTAGTSIICLCLLSGLLPNMGQQFVLQNNILACMHQGRMYQYSLVLLEVKNEKKLNNTFFSFDQVKSQFGAGVLRLDEPRVRIWIFRSFPLRSFALRSFALVLLLNSSTWGNS